MANNCVAIPWHARCLPGPADARFVSLPPFEPEWRPLEPRDALDGAPQTRVLSFVPHLVNQPPRL